MDNFKQYFNAEKPTKNSRQHHHNLLRSPSRKHQNQVAYMHGYKAAKDHPVITNIVKNKKYGGPWPLSYIDGKGILNAYKMTHTANKPYSKAINKTGITLHYKPHIQTSEDQPDSQSTISGKFFLTRNK